MPDTLSVHLSRTELHAVETPSSFETTDSFDVEFRNHGRSSRVHCTVDDALAPVVQVPETNRMIDSEGTLRMTVDVASVDEPVTGEFEVVTGYGAGSATVTLTVAPPEGRSSVESFDEAYGSDAEAAGIGGIALDRDDRLLLGLAVGAVLLALIAALLASDPVVMLGTVVVLAAIVVAGFLLWNE